jgi:competence ComEA-like helix-hairpin-helix protein
MISDVAMDRHIRTDEHGLRTGAVQSVGFTAAMCLCAVAGLALAARTSGGSCSRAAVEIDGTINPNDASPASLARLPGIGPARARAIVSYRSQLPSQPGRPIFHRPEDLQAIPGIGPATTEAIRPWLSFESRRNPAE